MRGAGESGHGVAGSAPCSPGRRTWGPPSRRPCAPGCAWQCAAHARQSAHTPGVSAVVGSVHSGRVRRFQTWTTSSTNSSHSPSLPAAIGPRRTVIFLPGDAPESLKQTIGWVRKLLYYPSNNETFRKKLRIAGRIGKSGGRNSYRRWEIVRDERGRRLAVHSCWPSVPACARAWIVSLWRPCRGCAMAGPWALLCRGWPRACWRRVSIAWRP